MKSYSRRGGLLDRFERVKNPKGRKRLQCIGCERLTIHSLEARCEGSWNDEYNHEHGGSYHSIYRCGACDFVCFETIDFDSHDYGEDEYGHTYLVQHAKQYPPPVSAHFSFNTESTPPKLDGILEEMLYSLAGAKHILATIGLRLAVEYIVNDKGCSGANLKQKIDDLHRQTVIDDDQKDLLHRIRRKGNAGAHGAVGMGPAELVAGMSIVEGLLEKLYNGPARHEQTIKKAKQLLKDEGDE